MLGVAYFQSRLVDIYDYALMSYKCGTGVFSWGGKHYEVSWEAIVSVTTELILVLSLRDNLPLFSSATMAERGDLKGETDDGTWSITATDVRVYNNNFLFDGVVSLRLVCAVSQFKVAKGESLSVTEITGHLTNFQFSGIEVSTQPKGKFLDRFSVFAYDRNIIFRQSPNLKGILEQIASKRIDRGALCTITVPVHQDETRDAIEDHLNQMCWFFSLINLNATLSRVVEYH